MQSVSIDLLKQARRYAAAQYRKLREDYRFSGHCSHAAAEAIRLAGQRFKIGYGCEGFCWDCGRDGVNYLNMGDTYDATIVFDSRTEQFRISCWGEVVERLERDGITLD